MTSEADSLIQPLPVIGVLLLLAAVFKGNANVRFVGGGVTFVVLCTALVVTFITGVPDCCSESVLRRSLYYASVMAVVVVVAFVVVPGAFVKLANGSPRSCKSKASLRGKTVIVTGANTGIGLEAAKDFAVRGARVIMACRSRQRAAPAVQEVKAACGHENVEFEELDLTSYPSIRSFVGRIQRKEHRLDILVNNAGLNAGTYTNEQGIDIIFAVNHLGTFLLTHQLLGLLKASAPARIINTSSFMHNKWQAKHGINLDKVDGQYKHLTGYDISKLANLLHSNELARRLAGTGVTANAVNPGAVSTGIYDKLDDSGPYLWSLMVRLSIKLCSWTPKQGAQTTIYCALDEALEGISGKYFDNCREKTPSKHALDEAKAKKLWDVSVELTGLDRKQ